MKVTVCQLSNYGGIVTQEWQDLTHHVEAEDSDLLLLPEMPFNRWLAADYTVNPDQWNEAVEVSQEWLELLLDFPIVMASTRPTTEDGVNRNRGFTTNLGEINELHTKRHLPNESGFWEARWYQAGTDDLVAFDVAGAKAGMVICSELWFLQDVQDLGQQGIDLLCIPRATMHESLEGWLAAGVVSAKVSGAYSLSSNLYRPRGGSADLGGMGWIIDPDGEVLATTDVTTPFVTVEIDLDKAKAAKDTYPRNLY